MPENKICTSIAVDSWESVHNAVSELESGSQFLEIRLDRLPSVPTIEELSSLRSASIIIFTFRPKSQGGFSELNPGARIAFWNSIGAGLGLIDEKNLFDIEHDILPHHTLPKDRVIGSIHDFAGDITDKDSVIDDIARHAALVKIAWTIGRTEESFEIFRLLRNARHEGKHLIPITMGEAGKLSRVLSVAMGSPFSYCAPSVTTATAPGQITASDMASLYRIDSITDSTKIFGLVAGDTSYSLSPRIHNTVFNGKKADSVFVPMQTNDIRQLIKGLLSDEFPFQLRGLAVTNPFKLAAMELADELDATAERTGAVNTLKFSEGRIIGFNTDVPGFINPLRMRVSDLKGAHVAVIGTGGASRAAVVALLGEGCHVKVFGRDARKMEAFRNGFGIETAELAGASFNGFKVVVNTTPLGTAGSMSQLTVAESSQLKGAELAYDLVYNPRETRFLKEAQLAGCETLGGLEMLVDQAMQQQRIWTDEAGDRDSILASLSD